jgi:gliding motility-associated-like protein
MKLSAQSGSSSFEFVENKGQWNNTILYKGELPTGAFFLQKAGFTVALHKSSDLSRLLDHHGTNQAPRPAKNIDYSKDLSGRVTDNAISGAGTEGIIHSHAYTVEFVGANPNALTIPDKVQDSYNNYIIGNNPAKWVQKAKIFGAVLYQDLYPNIDVRYYSENGSLKYDLIVKPGGDLSKVALKYTGPDKMTIREKNLIIKTSIGEVKELYPYSFQADNVKGRKIVDCRYSLAGNVVRFITGDYDKNTTLIVDPQVIFASFTGSSANQYGFTATPGPDGTLYSGGIVFGSGFPTTAGAYQSQYSNGGDGDGTDIGIMKFSANGSRRDYATYIGGQGNDYPHSLFCDPQGNLVVMGRSYSDDYPADRVFGNAQGANIVVTKLNASGTAKIGSLVIGGRQLDGVNIGDLQQGKQTHGNSSLIRNYGDDSRSEVVLDGGNNIYIAAQTQSDPADFAGVPGFQKIGAAGGQDGLVLKIDPGCTNVIWAKMIGGSKNDGAFVLDIRPTDGNIYVGFNTESTDFPGIAGGIGGSTFGDVDGVVAIVSPGGNLQQSTYIGTPGPDLIYGLKFDRKGFPYIMGVSRGGNFPVIQPQGATEFYSDPGSSQFIAKLQPDLSAYVFSTVFGSGSPKPNMSPVAFLVDRCENMYISGWGGWIGKQVEGRGDPYDQVGVKGMPISGDAYKPTTDNKDFYFGVIKKNSSALLYGTFFGQDGGAYGEHVDGGTSRYDQQGVIYQAMCANCEGQAKWPVTRGVIGPFNGALPNGCNLAAVKIAFNFAGVAAGPKAYDGDREDSTGCAPFTVTFRDTIGTAKSYIWNFGDGSPEDSTTDVAVVHRFDSVGTYRVRLIALDPESCNERDTAYTTIIVKQFRANLTWNVRKQEPCEAFNYLFENTSTFEGTKGFNDSSFTYDFGDGTRITGGKQALLHPMPGPGVYTVRLILNDSFYCNAPDSIEMTLRVNSLVEARFETPPAGCAPYDAVFTNTSLAGQNFEWNFGDGQTSNDASPVFTHTYTDPGTYSIHLIARDSGTCNKIDDTTVTITVSSKPTAEFSTTPVTPVQNQPISFTNLSTGGVRYKWLFEDGDSTVTNSTNTLTHQYNASGTYNAVLITYNQYGCTDTAIHEVIADVLPLYDVPNAFTPGKPGRNSVIRVQGFGIASMSWKIYNRWGQKVFETNDVSTGWDGTMKGKLLPMDVYAYTLDVVMTDGTKSRKTGDITLIR